MTLLRAAFAALALLAAPLAHAAPPMGEDGLHKPGWLKLTFKDMAEDMEAAAEEGKRLLLLFEQRGCIYCKKMHTQVFVAPDIEKMLREDFYVVQMNLFGDEEVVDLDGTALPEKAMARRWGIMFTPTLVFLPQEAGEAGRVSEAAVAVMPGAFERGTTRHLLQWVLEKGYESEEHFQKYLARRLAEAREAAD